MSRQKISEYRAKTLIVGVLGESYQGKSIDLKSYDPVALKSTFAPSKTYVVKVDQAIKKRNMLGLVKLELTPQKVLKELKRLQKEGYSWALIEEFYPHSQQSEAFFALAREEGGIRVSFSTQGGVHVESHADQIQTELVKNGKIAAIAVSKPTKRQLQTLFDLFETAHMTYLEINPLIIKHGTITSVLDAAVEVDTAAEFFVDGVWNKRDFRDPKKAFHETEQAVEALAATSPSSLSLKVLNENGSLFLLLSGGGASVVVVDEIAHLGFHQEIANYGEYSGNPTEEETYLYTKQVLRLLIDSSSKHKTLIIAGGVANFTDVAKTFKGIIRAIRDNQQVLSSQHVKVFVRRGGPNQKTGLAEMEDFLKEIGIEHSVNGPELSLSGVVRKAVKGWNSDQFASFA